MSWLWNSHGDQNFARNWGQGLSGLGHLTTNARSNGEDWNVLNGFGLGDIGNFAGSVANSAADSLLATSNAIGADVQSRSKPPVNPYDAILASMQASAAKSPMDASQAIVNKYLANSMAPYTQAIGQAHTDYKNAVHDNNAYTADLVHSMDSARNASATRATQVAAEATAAGKHELAATGATDQFLQNALGGGAGGAGGDLTNSLNHAQDSAKAGMAARTAGAVSKAQGNGKADAQYATDAQQWAKLSANEQNQMLQRESMKQVGGLQAALASKQAEASIQAEQFKQSMQHSSIDDQMKIAQIMQQRDAYGKPDVNKIIAALNGMGGGKQITAPGNIGGKIAQQPMFLDKNGKPTLTPTNHPYVTQDPNRALIFQMLGIEDPTAQQAKPNVHPFNWK